MSGIDRLMPPSTSSENPFKWLSLYYEMLLNDKEEEKLHLRNS